MAKKNVTAIIPARGGSKGIYKKNIKLLAGKPLIYYTIKAALDSDINRIIISTDDKEIQEVAKEYKVEVIKRPIELAKDDSLTIDVVIHLLGILKSEKYKTDIVVLLQPTSPLRNGQDITNALEIFYENECDSVISVSETQHSPYWSFNITGKYLKTVFGNKYYKMRRQELPKTFMPNGAIYISTPEKILKNKSFYGKKIKPHIMPMERSIDIDTQYDFEIAEFIMKK